MRMDYGSGLLVIAIAGMACGDGGRQDEPPPIWTGLSTTTATGSGGNTEEGDETGQKLDVGSGGSSRSASRTSGGPAR